MVSLYFAIYPDGLKTERTSLSAAVLLSSLIFASYGSWPRPVQQTYRSPERLTQGFHGTGCDEPSL